MDSETGISFWLERRPPSARRYEISEAEPLAWLERSLSYQKAGDLRERAQVSGDTVPSEADGGAARDVLSGLTLLHRRVRRRHPEV